MVVSFVKQATNEGLQGGGMKIVNDRQSGNRTLH